MNLEPLWVMLGLAILICAPISAICVVSQRYETIRNERWASVIETELVRLHNDWRAKP